MLACFFVTLGPSHHILKTKEDKQMDRILCELNDILWNVEAMKSMSVFVRLSGVDAESLPTDHLMLLFENNLTAVAGRIHTLADRVEKVWMAEN